MDTSDVLYFCQLILSTGHLKVIIGIFDEVEEKIHPGAEGRKDNTAAPETRLFRTSTTLAVSCCYARR